MIDKRTGLYDSLYWFLASSRLCRNKTDFAQRFFAKSPSYWRAIEQSGAAPSIGATMRLLAELEKLADTTPLPEATTGTLREFVVKVRADISRRVGGGAQC